VDALVVIVVQPLSEKLVQALEGKALGQDRDELHPDGPEETFDLTSSFGDVGAGVEQGDAEAAAGVGEGIGPKG
jgi:hypothetical protein